MNNRYVLIILILLMFITPVVDAGNQTANPKPHVLATHDIVIEAISWTSFSVYCLEGDTLSGEFRLVNDGDLFPGHQTKYDNWLLGGVDFLILDEDSYNSWLEKSTVYPIFERESLIELEWSIEIPRSGTWYVVYSNDSIFMKQIEGSIVRSGPNDIVIMIAGLIGAVALLSLILISKKKK